MVRISQILQRRLATADRAIIDHQERCPGVSTNLPIQPTLTQRRPELGTKQLLA